MNVLKTLQYLLKYIFDIIQPIQLIFIFLHDAQVKSMEITISLFLYIFLRVGLPDSMRIVKRKSFIYFYILRAFRVNEGLFLIIFDIFRDKG